jgi:two-component system, response regulator PdtaR
MHALIIEDESLIAMVIEDVLRNCGFDTIDIAPSPEAAFEAVARKCPTLITSDVQLKPGCGIETVLQIRDKELIPVIFITGNVTEVRDRVPNVPVLSKPFNKTQLVKAVAFVLP